jgi:hypothetical protein
MKRYNPIEFRYGELVLADTVECEIGDYYRVSDVDDEINTLKSEIELKDKEIAVLKDKLAAIVSGDIGVLPYDHDYFGGADKPKNKKEKGMNIIEAARKAKKNNAGRITLTYDGYTVYGTLQEILIEIPNDYLYLDGWEPGKVKHQREMRLFIGESSKVSFDWVFNLPIGTRVKATFEWEE